jgi:hypothetical protein
MPASGSRVTAVSPAVWVTIFTSMPVEMPATFIDVPQDSECDAVAKRRDEPRGPPLNIKTHSQFSILHSQFLIK